MIKNSVVIVTISLMVTLLLGGLPCYASPSDVAGTSYEQAVDCLSNLKIINGYKDGTFKPQESITRAEFATIMARVMGLGDVGNSTNNLGIFNDVASTSWAAGYINTVYKLNIVNGYDNGNFGPDDLVTGEQAVKMVVCALGYDLYAKDKGGYPSGYAFVAGEKKLFKNVGNIGVEPINRGSVAQLLFNSLDVDMMQQTVYGDKSNYQVLEGVTLLTKYLKVEKHNGTVKGVGLSTFSTSTSLKNDEVMVDDTVMEIGDCQVRDLLGLNVTYYAKLLNDSDDEMTLLKITERNSGNSLTVKAENIDSSTTTTSLKYYTDENNSGKAQAETILSTAKMIYNGKLATISSDKLKPTNGYVKLVSTSGSGGYDLVIVKDYKDFVVDGVLNDGKNVTLYDKLKTSNVEFTLNSNKYNVSITKKGISIGADAIEKLNIASIAKSEDGTVVEIMVSDVNLSGTISEVATSSEKDKFQITVNSVNYRVTSDYLSSINSHLAVGDDGTFYVDAFGKVAYAELGQSSNTKYGYIVDAKLISKLDSYVSLRVLTTDNKYVVLNTTNKIKFQDNEGIPSTLTPSELMDKLNVPATDVNPVFNPTTLNTQLISYELNQKGDISDLYFAKITYGIDGNTYAPDDKLFSNDVKEQYMMYASNEFEGKYFVDANTKVFTIYGDGYTNFDDTTRAIDATKKLQTVVAPSDAFSSGTRYQVTFYDVDKKNHVAVVLYRKFVSGTLPSKDSTLIDPVSIDFANSKVMYVDKVSTIVNSDGEDVMLVSGYQNGAYVSMQVGTDNISDNQQVPIDSIKVGMVIQYETNASALKKAYYQGEPEQIVVSNIIYNPVAFTYILKDDAGKPVKDIDNNDVVVTVPATAEGQLWNNTDVINGYADLKTSYGTVTSIEDKTFFVSFGDGNAPTPFISNDSMTVMINSSGTGTITCGLFNDLQAGDKIFVRECRNQVREILIFR